MRELMLNFLFFLSRPGKSSILAVPKNQNPQIVENYFPCGRIVDSLITGIYMLDYQIFKLFLRNPAFFFKQLLFITKNYYLCPPLKSGVYIIFQ